jgi:hypothetical protein
VKTKIIPDGLYADARPDGHWVCSVGDTVLSSWGDLGAPRAMMFNRLGPDRFILASKSASPGTVWVYDGQWRDTGIDSYGVQGHGWNPVGNLSIMPSAPHQDPMGLRYYDPSAPPGSNLDVTGTTAGWVTGSPSYTPSTALAQSLHVSRLFEWTNLGGGIFVGQGDSGGTVLQHPAHGHRILVDGDSRFVQAHRTGTTICVAVTRLSQRDSVCVWFEESEIASFPVYPLAVDPPIDPPIDPVDPPVETPVPTPDPRLVQIVTDHWNASGIEAYTAAHFHEHDEHYWKQRHAQVLYEGYSIAYHKQGIRSFGVYPKSPGVTAYQPFPDKPDELYAEDVCEILDGNGVMYWKDVGGGFGGQTPTMNWGEFSRSADADQHPGAYLPPPNLTSAVTPPVEPPVTPPASCQCQPQIDALTKQVAALDKRVAELERRPPSTDINGKRIALMADNGKFVCADFERGEDGPLVANRENASGWETFTIAEVK